MAEQTPPKEKLVGDLETLVTLLEEGKDPTLDMFADDPIPPSALSKSTSQATGERAAANQPEHDVTAQDQMLVPDVAGESAPEAGPESVADFSPDFPPDFPPETATPTPPDLDMFDALLGDEWRTQSSELLQTASAKIQAQQLDWNPEDTQTLTDALRVRLDQSIQGWLQTTLAEQISGLRQQLLLDLQDELTQRVNQTLDINQHRRQEKEQGLRQLAEDPDAPTAPTGNP